MALYMYETGEFHGGSTINILLDGDADFARDFLADQAAGESNDYTGLGDLTFRPNGEVFYADKVNWYAIRPISPLTREAWDVENAARAVD